MIINYKNKDIIDSRQIYIHDSTFIGCNYHYLNNQISFQTKNECCNKIFAFKFFNVFSFKMKSFEPWGESPYVLDWETIKDGDDYLLNEIVKEIDDNNYDLTRLKDYNELVSSIITLSSGDTLTIVAEYIEFEEVNLLAL